MNEHATRTDAPTRTGATQDADTPSMRAAVLDRYGSADNLQQRNVARPICKDDQVLVAVRAAGINPIDWRIRNGSLRMILPARLPAILGFDVSGEVVEVGSAAKRESWSVGDEVMCFLDRPHGGGYAEYAAAGVGVTSHKPSTISFEEAAAIPLAGSTALQSLRDLGQVEAGHEVLINGASGGVGVFAVQLAKAFGACVTGVCSEKNLDFVRDLGADCVIDYTREDFTSLAKRYDIIFDAVAKSSYWKCRRILKPKGRFITTLPTTRSLFFQAATKLIGPRCLNILVRRRSADLQLIARFVEEGKVRPVVQHVYPLEDVREAQLVSEAGHVRGKLVLSI